MPGLRTPGGVPSLLSQAPGLSGPVVLKVPFLNFSVTRYVLSPPTLLTTLTAKNRKTWSCAQSGPHVPESVVSLSNGPNLVTPGSDERMVGSSVAKKSSICVCVSRSRIPSSAPPSPAGAAEAGPGVPIVSAIANAETTATDRATKHVSISQPPLTNQGITASYRHFRGWRPSFLRWRTARRIHPRSILTVTRGVERPPPHPRGGTGAPNSSAVRAHDALVPQIPAIS